MSIESLANFKSSYADLPIAGAGEFPTNLANWFEQNIAGLALANIGGPGLSFTFNKATLIAQLSALPTTPQPAATAIAAMADCFVAALTASTWVLSPLSYLAEPSVPANTFSSVTTTTPLLTGVKAKIQELAAVDPNSVQSVDASPFPEKIREAVLTITVTSIGLDSTPSPAGPLPLTDPARSVI